MSKPLENKIDFAVIISVNNANPNGDPLNGNRPRQTYDGFGEISDVCLKRKLRNRLQDFGENILVQMAERTNDGEKSIKDRYNAAVKKSDKGEWNPKVDSCSNWYDVRAFGQVLAFKSKNKKEASDDAGEDAVSIGVRGPVTIQSAYSLERVVVETIQITKSVNLETDAKNPDKRASDTVGAKHRVENSVYVSYGSISPNLAKNTGFSYEDAEKLKAALRSLFENDASSARPEGSMHVGKVVWWQHNLPCGQYSTFKVHQALKSAILSDGRIDEDRVRNALPGLSVEFLDQLEGRELGSYILAK